MSEPAPVPAPRTLRSLDDLVAAGLVTARAAADLAPVAARYAIGLTPAMADLIDISDAHDPIARQFLPDPREAMALPGERADPIGDHAHSPVRGLVHRYPDRVLLKVVGVCPVYCRFCFRREMVGPSLGEALSADDLEAALAYIAAHTNVREVILTGGDPLMLSARRMAEVTGRLSAIPHVDTLRWHTRVPVVDPARVTEDLVAALAGRGPADGSSPVVSTSPAHRPAVFVAIHANHAREITPAARGALQRLADAGIALLGQTVLLRGVNDDSTALEALLRALVAARVKPYYLHHGDLAPGTAHHRTTLAHGMALVAGLRGRLSGLALPTYVIDIPGGHGKVPVAPPWVERVDGAASGPGRWRLTDPTGRAHAYEDLDAEGQPADLMRSD